MTGPAEGRSLARFLPAWATGYERPWLRDDVTSGLTLVVMLVPQAMAYASLAGMPPITGLYAAATALLVYALVGSSSHLSYGPVALVALLTASALGPLARAESGRYLALAGVLALLVGGMHLLLAAMRAGAIIDLISHPVVVGFTAGAAVIIGLSQVRDLTGVDVERSGRFVDAVALAFRALTQAHPLTLGIGVACLLALLLGRRVVPRMPTSLVVSVAAIIAAVAFGLPERGVAVIGEIPSGLPRPNLPSVTWDDVRALLPPAAVIAAIAYAESVSIAKAIAARSRERIDPNRELLGSGLANLAAGLMSGLPVAGSFTRTAVVHNAGARTQLAGVIAALIVVLTLAVLTPLLEPLPRVVLAAIVLVAVISLIDGRAAIAILRVDRIDGGVLIATFLATLGLGVELGLLTGIALNLVAHVAQGMRPALVELGRVPGTRLYRDVERFGLVTDPSGVILRLDGPLDFLSVEQVTGQLRRLAADRPEIDWVVLDASGVTRMDSSGVHALQTTQEHLSEAGVALHLATLRGRQRDVIERAGLWSQLMESNSHVDLPSALTAVGIPSDGPLLTPRDHESVPDGLR